MPGGITPLPALPGTPTVTGIAGPLPDDSGGNVNDVLASAAGSVLGSQGLSLPTNPITAAQKSLDGTFLQAETWFTSLASNVLWDIGFILVIGLLIYAAVTSKQGE